LFPEKLFTFNWGLPPLFASGKAAIIQESFDAENVVELVVQVDPEVGDGVKVAVGVGVIVGVFVGVGV
jgi:hypothetical protein